MAKLISVSEALALIAKTPTLPETSVELKDAFDHVLSQDVFAKVTLPPHDASAMDGYAVKLELHHKQGSSFTLIGEAPAGRPYDGAVGANETVRIFTGGALPNGANHVVMQENVSADSGADATTITLTEAVSPASHIRKSGIDFKTGDKILSKGRQIGAYELAILAAANCDLLPVNFAPKVALIANGDELVAPGKAVHDGQVISSNPYGLIPLLNSWGANTINMGISKDDPKAIRAQIKRAVYQGADILVPIGGASVGDHDYMRPVFTELGYDKTFEKVAVKPGKPVWFGRLNQQYVLGLPGNPASALVTAHLFLQPLIKALTGASTTHKYVTAQATHSMKAATWRAEYIRAHAVIDENGTVQVTAIPRQDSSLLTPFLTANCFLVRDPETPELTIGDRAKIMMIKPLD